MRIDRARHDSIFFSPPMLESGDITRTTRSIRWRLGEGKKIFNRWEKFLIEGWEELRGIMSNCVEFYGVENQ